MNEAQDRLLMPVEDVRYALGGVGRTMVYELVDAGELERVKIGRRGLITAASVRAYVGRLSDTARAGATGVGAA